MRTSATSQISAHAPAAQAGKAARHAHDKADAASFNELLEGAAPQKKAAQKDAFRDVRAPEASAQKEKVRDKPSDEAHATDKTETARADDKARPEKTDASKDKTAEVKDADAQQGDADPAMMAEAPAQPVAPSLTTIALASLTGTDAEDGGTEETAPVAAATAAAAQTAAAQASAEKTSADPCEASLADSAESPAPHKTDAQPHTAEDAARGEKVRKTADAAPDSIKPDAAKADATPIAAADAPRPQQQAANTNLAASIAPADASAPAQGPAPSITRHIEVAQQPQAEAPNLPRLAVEIAARSLSGARQFDIRLDPPELGRVEVRLSIDHAGKASAHVSADQPQTLDLLQKDSTSLTRALREAGLDVSQDGLNFSLRQQAGGHQNEAGREARGATRGTMHLQATQSLEATGASAAYRAPADGRLDIKV